MSERENEQYMRVSRVMKRNKNVTLRILYLYIAIFILTIQKRYCDVAHVIFVYSYLYTK